MNVKARCHSYTLHKHFLFRAFLCFLWLIPPACVAKDATRPPAKKQTPTAPDRFEPETAAFEKGARQNAVPRDGILFVGSSSIRLWQTAEAFPNLPVINRGFGGSTVPDVNHYAERIVY